MQLSCFTATMSCGVPWLALIDFFLLLLMGGVALLVNMKTKDELGASVAEIGTNLKFLSIPENSWN